VTPRSTSTERTRAVDTLVLGEISNMRIHHPPHKAFWATFLIAGTFFTPSGV
jgi:hypothetical protein